MAYEKKLHNIYPENPRCYHAYIVTQPRFKPPTYLYSKSNGRVIIHKGAKQIAEAFSKFFYDIYIKETTVGHKTIKKSKHTLGKLDFDNEYCIDRLAQLNSGVSGPDAIGSLALKKICDILGPPLSIIYHKSLKEGVLPQEWKIAKITPKFKRDDIHEVENYRPIAVVSNICKVLEDIVVNHLLNYLSEHNLITPHQHGTVNSRSVTTNLMYCLDHWTEAIQNGECIDIIYLDVKKATDTIPQERLLHKLMEYGITGYILKWITYYLIDREQYVQIHACRSSNVTIKSGVPQGTKLSNILFTLFINDLPKKLENKIAMFNDDFKVFSVVNNVGDNSLQRDIDTLNKWAESNLMSFGLDKARVMHLGRSNPCKVYYMNLQDGSKHPIKAVLEQTDLGIVVDNRLSFTEQVDQVIEQTNGSINYMRLNFSIITPAVFKQYYPAFIRQKVENGASIWCPSNKKHKDSLERCQEVATKYVHGLKGKSYNERLQVLDLPTLESRRLRQDFIEIYRCLHSDAEYNIQCRSEPRLYTLVKGKNLEPVRANFLFERSGHQWNLLSEETVSADSIDSFKRKLDKELQSDSIYQYQFDT